MRALLLAAGFGTRLQPVTDYIPKCLVPINGKPLLEYWLENLSAAGVEEFLINTHYMHEKVQDYINSSIYKDKVTLVYESELLNTGGTILANKEFFSDEPFMLVHADNLCFCDFEAFILSHKKRDKECEITMMLFESDTPQSCGIVTLDSRGVVEEFYEKVQNPPSNLANGAVYICENSVVKFLESLGKEEIDFSKEVLPKYLGKIGTYMNETYHRDIGTLKSYSLAQIECKEYL